MPFRNYLARLLEIDSSSYNFFNAQLKIGQHSGQPDFQKQLEYQVQTEVFSRVMKKCFDCLIVEDDIELSESLRTNLQLQGFNVDTAKDINQFDRKVQTNYYTVLFVDINMPVSSVNSYLTTIWPFLYNFRTYNQVTSIYITSAYAQEMHNVKDHQSLGIAAHLQKPFISNLLVPYLRSDLALCAQRAEYIQNHPQFCLDKWRLFKIAEFCQTRLDLVDGDYHLASELCNVSERTIRRAISVAQN